MTYPFTGVFHCRSQYRCCRLKWDVVWLVAWNRLQILHHWMQVHQFFNTFHHFRQCFIKGKAWIVIWKFFVLHKESIIIKNQAGGIKLYCHVYNSNRSESIYWCEHLPWRSPWSSFHVSKYSTSFHQEIEQVVGLMARLMILVIGLWACCRHSW